MISDLERNETNRENEEEKEPPYGVKLLDGSEKSV